MHKFRSLLFLFALLAALWPPLDSAAQGPVILKVSPQISYASTSSETMVAVRVENVENMVGYSLNILFDPLIVDVLEVKNADFLDDISVLYAPTNKIDNENGEISFGMVLLNSPDDPPKPKSGSGDLIVIRLRAKIPGNTTSFTIVREESDLIDDTYLEDQIEFDTFDGTIITDGESRLFLPLVVR